MSGFAGASVCVYGKVGNFRRPVYAILSNVEYRNGVRINGEMQVRDIGRWRAALWKSQRAIETSRVQVIHHYRDTTKSIIVGKEPPYADPHVRWCERSENKSRRKTYFCFPPTRLLSLYHKPLHSRSVMNFVCIAFAITNEVGVQFRMVVAELQ